MPDEQLDMPMGGEGGEGGEGAGPSHEELEQYAKHCMSHPFAQKHAAHYAMADKPMEGDKPPADPTMPPTTEEPKTFGAEVASPTNGEPPMPPEDEPGRFRKNAEAIRYARLETEMKALRQEAAQAKAEQATAKAEQIVTQLVAEGYDLDETVEVLHFARLDPAGRQKHEAHVRRYYRQAPIGGQRIPVADDAPSRNDEPTPRQADDAIRYMRDRPGMSYPDAVAHIRSNGKK